MKTISGKVKATRAISLSKAAKFMSSFVSAESEASNAVSNYLRRTSSAFDELSQLHRQLRSDPDRKKHRSAEKPEPELKSELKKEEEGDFEAKPDNLDLVRESESKKRRKAEKRSASGGESVNFSGVVEKGDDSVETSKKTKKKKIEEGTKVVEKEEENVGINESIKKEVKSENVEINESIEKKKKKKKKGEEGKLGEAGEKGEIEKSGNVCEESLGIDDVGKKKKRKMIEAEGVGNDDSEPRRAKKKRRKMD